MAFLMRYGHMQPSEFSEEIRRHGMTSNAASRIQDELIKLRKHELDLELTIAKISRGGAVR